MSYSRFTIGISSELYERLKELKWISRKPVSVLIEEMISSQIVQYEEHYKWLDIIQHSPSYDTVVVPQVNLSGKTLYRIKYKPTK